MRLIVMFDVPSVTSKDKKEYVKWHRFLIQSGFVMMTESVYSRLLMNRTLSNAYRKIIKKNLPANGNIQILEITERQYNSIEYCIENKNNNIIDSIERYIEI